MGSTGVNTLLWIVQGIVAVAFFGPGLLKIVVPFAKMKETPRTAWVEGRRVSTS